MREYRIRNTEYYPRHWKVERIGARPNNSLMWYHRLYDDALRQIDSLGGTLVSEADSTEQSNVVFSRLRPSDLLVGVHLVRLGKTLWAISGTDIEVPLDVLLRLQEERRDRGPGHLDVFQMHKSLILGRRFLLDDTEDESIVTVHVSILEEARRDAAGQLKGWFGYKGPVQILLCKGADKCLEEQSGINRETD